MSGVAIVDTTVFLNVLDVPNRNADRHRILSDLKALIQSGTTLLLPMAAVYETGNHIAQLPDGGNRRRFAAKFVEQVEKAICGTAPWQAMKAPTTEQVGQWLADFPVSAMREAGMGDLSIIKEWEEARKRTPHLRVFIWSLDGDLDGYDHNP